VAGYKLDASGNRVWVDDDNFITKAPASHAFMGGDPVAYDPAAIGQAQRQGVREAGVAAGIGALGEAAQFGLSFVQTAQDRRNKERLADLRGREKSGTLGLTGAEREQMDNTLMDPVRALAGEEATRMEGTIAAKGGTTSAADLVRVQRESDRRVDSASIAAGNEINRANLAAAADQRNELDERASYQSDRQRSRIDQIGATLLGLAKTGGKVLAANPSIVGVSDQQLVAMQDAKDDQGRPLYPGYVGLSVAQMQEVNKLARRGMGEMDARKQVLGEVDAAAPK
jgi:hypothetical protein